MDSSAVEVLYLHRGRFVALPGVELRQLAPNAWELRVPRSEDVQRVLRAEPAMDMFDESVWMVDGVESIHAVGSGEDGEGIQVTILLP